MKQIFLVLAFLCSALFAQEADWDNYQWPRSYFASVGFSVIATRGDFSDRIIKLKNEDGIEETLNLPTAKVLVSPDYNIGVNIREFTLAAAFQYWSMMGTVNNSPVDHKMRYWRLGVEFTYNFFYPDDFQVGAGLGYSFSSFKVKDNAFSSNGSFDSELMGSGVAIVTNMKYFITEHIGLSPSLRIYETWYKAANTKTAGTQDLKSYVWQTYIAVSINAMVRF